MKAWQVYAQSFTNSKRLQRIVHANGRDEALRIASRTLNHALYYVASVKPIHHSTRR